jgi:TPR repeat protein
MTFELLVSQAEAGDAEAQNSLGHMHATGFGVPKNDAGAIRLYVLAAEKGKQTAQFSLDASDRPAMACRRTMRRR